MKFTEEILSQIRSNIAHAKKSEYYGKLLADIEPDEIKTESDFQKLPFSDKEDLRAAYPLGLSAVPNEEIVRIHSSSGTTGTAVIIPYTQKDIDDWAAMFARCYEMAGVTRADRIHITPGYGLWTAGIGFQLGAEKLGAMTIPMGPGNTDKQIKMMIDLGSTVLTATSSYALLLAEEIEKRGIKDKIKLRKGIIGSERWGDKMRARIADELGVELYDIYGLTECYGPGIGISCPEEDGMHMWTDYLYYEIIDPKTLKPVAEGESGELVITTLQKEGAPLVRYRTHDLTREITGECKCGSKFPRISTLIGRSDDMIKVKGTIIFPALVDGVLTGVDGVSSEYQIIIDHLNGRDIMRLFFETAVSGAAERKALEKQVAEVFKSKVGSTPETHAVSLGELPRSEKKTTRIFDNRY
ncbi:MAG: phenylacetate--CoA ligase [Oscillospiraceae bacterium]|jgi:phenylacetate-CoA ligase|nr:phenylacetate--CoA ligase [Oscillospiraceae bacterium]